jgi:tRNA wybutosine-synthesizing protein 1
MDEKLIKEYAKLDSKADPLFIEPKGYVFVGYSRKRMNISNMPSYENVKDFSDKLNKELGYNFLMEKSDSRVVLLSKSLKPARFDK